MRRQNLIMETFSGDTSLLSLKTVQNNNKEKENAEKAIFTRGTLGFGPTQ